MPTFLKKYPTRQSVGDKMMMIAMVSWRLVENDILVMLVVMTVMMLMVMIVMMMMVMMMTKIMVMMTMMVMMASVRWRLVENDVSFKFGDGANFGDNSSQRLQPTHWSANHPHMAFSW